MKTLYKTYDFQQIRNKQIELEDKTNLKWDFYHIGDGYVITPVVTRDTPMCERAAEMLLPWLGHDYRNFITLAEISLLPLVVVVSGAKTLVQTGRAVATVNRNGLFYGVRKA